MQYAYKYVLIPAITIIDHSKHKMGIMIEFALKSDAICIYIYNPIPEITILGHSDPKMHITIEFTLKFDAICMYICPDSRNYHIRSL